MPSVLSSIKHAFHGDMVANPVSHGWVLNLYRSGERYPQRVCDYFQADFAPCERLAARLRLHAAEEDKHVKLFDKALAYIGQPVIEADAGDVFNEVVREFTPGTFHIVESDDADTRRRKLANFLAHAHQLEKRVAQSFAFHVDACERHGRDAVGEIVARAKTDEDEHVRYTREAVMELMTRREAAEVLDLHRRAEARANLIFSQRQVRVFVARFGEATPRARRWLYRLSAGVMEAAGSYV